jgi:hypothetical protein
MGISCANGNMLLLLHFHTFSPRESGIGNATTEWCLHPDPWRDRVFARGKEDKQSWKRLGYRRLFGCAWDLVVPMGTGKGRYHAAGEAHHAASRNAQPRRILNIADGGRQ